MAIAQVIALDEYRHETWETFIARIGTALSVYEHRSDGASWEKAQLLIDADQEAATYTEMQGKKPWQVHHRVTQDLRQYWSEQRLPHPTPSFLSHTRKLYHLWPEVFGASTKNSSFDSYRLIAVSSLPREDKETVREWIEAEHPRREEIRQRIRDRVDAMKGVCRPDFELKHSNHWIFQVEKREDGFDGGVNYALYANLIHHFSDPGHTILDPCAGGGILLDTLCKYRHFQEVTAADGSGPRHALMSDITPTRDDIVQADLREGLPFPDHCAHLILLDPPYWRMGNGKFADLGDSLETWLVSFRVMLLHIHRCLIPGGRLVTMTDDFVRKQLHVPLGLLIMQELSQGGWRLDTTIYNFNRNYITTMSPIDMARAQRAKLLPSAVKILQVACRDATCT